MLELTPRSRHQRSYDGSDGCGSPLRAKTIVMPKKKAKRERGKDGVKAREKFYVLGILHFLLRNGRIQFERNNLMLLRREETKWGKKGECVVEGKE